MLTVIYPVDGGVRQSQDAADVRRLLGEGVPVFWLDLEAPVEAEWALLVELFRFHPLAVEDARHPHQRPKLDEYEGYSFITCDEVASELPDGEEAVPVRQMSAFLSERYLVTIHVEPLETVRELRSRCDQHAAILERGPDFVLYSLLDVLVDRYFPLLDGFDDAIDTIEDRIVGRPERGTLDAIFTVKRQVGRLRKHAGPLRQVLQTLTSRDFTGVRADTVPYFRDVSDHILRIYDTLDNDRDLMTNMLDAYLSQVSNEMNRVMQKLSVVATVFLPLTFLTGVFGMNFERQPWFHTSFWAWMWGMVVVGVLMLLWFRRRHLM